MQSHDANALCKHTLENTQIDSGIYSHFCVGLKLTTAALVHVVHKFHSLTALPCMP